MRAGGAGRWRASAKRVVLAASSAAMVSGVAINFEIPS